MTPNNLDLTSISPARGAKFSPNLYRFLLRARSQAIRQYGRVYRDESGTLWLGYFFDGDLIGARLMNVLCEGAKTTTFSFSKLGPLIEVEDFWSRYQAIGRCAIDPEHAITFIDDKTRWEEDGEQRECLWCSNARQHRVIRTRQVSYDSWETI